MLFLLLLLFCVRAHACLNGFLALDYMMIPFYYWVTKKRMAQPKEQQQQQQSQQSTIAHCIAMTKRIESENL